MEYGTTYKLKRTISVLRDIAFASHELLFVLVLFSGAIIGISWVLKHVWDVVAETWWSW